MKYRKKPVVIEAVQWDGANWNEICDFINVPENGYGKFGEEKDREDGKADLKVVIHTLEGDMAADIDDYIIKSVHGDFCPCKKDIFEATYERVEAD